MAIRIRIPRWHEMDKNATPLPQLAEDFLLAKRSSGCSEKTISWYRDNLLAYMRFLENEGEPPILRSFSVKNVRRFFREQPIRNPLCHSLSTTESASRQIWNLGSPTWTGSTRRSNALGTGCTTASIIQIIPSGLGTDWEGTARGKPIGRPGPHYGAIRGLLGPLTPAANSRVPRSCQVALQLQGAEVHLGVLDGDDVVLWHRHAAAQKTGDVLLQLGLEVPVSGITPATTANNIRQSGTERYVAGRTSDDKDCVSLGRVHGQITQGQPQ